MPLNPYHNHYESENEQDLTDQLIVEAIQMKGVMLKYLPRQHNNYDFLFGEDPTSSFRTAIDIEAYPTDVTGFGGEGEMFSKFGLEARNTATFVVSKSRFLEEIKTLYPDMIRPREGDLIYFPLTKAILEIRFVQLESPFFEQGKQYVYEIKTEAYEYSYEQIPSGDSGIDSEVLDALLTFDPETETEAFGDNSAFDTRIDPQTEFDPYNPFGVE